MFPLESMHSPSIYSGAYHEELFMFKKEPSTGFNCFHKGPLKVSAYDEGYDLSNDFLSACVTSPASSPPPPLYTDYPLLLPLYPQLMFCKQCQFLVNTVMSEGSLLPPPS